MLISVTAPSLHIHLPDSIRDSILEDYLRDDHHLLVRVCKQWRTLVTSYQFEETQKLFSAKPSFSRCNRVYDSILVVEEINLIAVKTAEGLMWMTKDLIPKIQEPEGTSLALLSKFKNRTKQRLFFIKNKNTIKIIDIFKTTLKPSIYPILEKDLERLLMQRIKPKAENESLKIEACFAKSLDTFTTLAYNNYRNYSLSNWRISIDGGVSKIKLEKTKSIKHSLICRSYLINNTITIRDLQVCATYNADTLDLICKPEFSVDRLLHGTSQYLIQQVNGSVVAFQWDKKTNWEKSWQTAESPRTSILQSDDSYVLITTLSVENRGIEVLHTHSGKEVFKLNLKKSLSSSSIILISNVHVLAIAFLTSKHTESMASFVNVKTANLHLHLHHLPTKKRFIQKVEIGPCPPQTSIGQEIGAKHPPLTVNDIQINGNRATALLDNYFFNYIQIVDFQLPNILSEREQKSRQAAPSKTLV